MTSYSLTLKKGKVRVRGRVRVARQDVLNFRQGKRERLGLGLGLQGETSGRHELSPRKKGKVRVRGRVRVARRDVLNFRQGKRVWLGLGVGLGLQGKTS